MLQSIRQLAHSWVVKSLMLFLIISFSIWGIGDIFRGNSLQKTVASVGGIDISVQQLNQLFEKALYEARQKFDPKLTPAQARQMGLLDQALEREITRHLIDLDIKRKGISVPAETILNMLSAQPQFRMEDGSFNKNLFRQILEQQRISEAAFIAQGQQDLSRQILVGALDGTSYASQAAIDALYKARAQKRTLDVVVVDSGKMGDIPSPSEKTLRDFYDKNQSLFVSAEYRGLTVATLSTDSLLKEVSVPEDRIRKEYDARLTQLKTPERRDVIQVVLQNQDKADALAAQAKSSGDLSAAAGKQGATVVPLDQMEQKNLIPELSKAVFALRDGGVGGPIKTQLGWHVVQLKKIHLPSVPSYDKVKDKLKDDLLRDQAIEAATRIVNELDDQLAAGKSLDEVADGSKVVLTKIAASDANGLDPKGKALEIPHKEQVLSFAFAQSAGETSPVEDDKSGNYFLVRTEDITPSGVRAFDDVKDKVQSAWKQHEQALQAQEKAEKIAKALGEGKAAASFDRDEGVTSRTSSPLSLLGDTDKQLPQSLVVRAFSLERGGTAMQDENGKQYVIRLANIVNVDGRNADPRKNLIAREIRAAESNELFQQYLRHLRTAFKVKTNAGLLAQLRETEE